AFAGVAQAFIDNFEQHNEVGASVCITVDGKPVVDLWGGHANKEQSQPWQEDTISVVFSSTKGAVALAAHTLIDAGELELDKPVAHYWPEFATAGKEHATVRMMLNHSAAVPCLRQKLPDLACCDWQQMVEKIAAEEAFWEPGTRHGYHMINFGWTVGELIRRVSGESLGAYFQRAIATPSGADFWIGLPESEDHRVASMIPYRPPKDAPRGKFTLALLGEPNGISQLALFNQGGFNPAKAECRRAEIGGAGGIGNGRSLAQIYAPFAVGGSLNNHNFVGTDTLAAMAEVSAASLEDATLRIPTRFGLGFMKSMDNRALTPGNQDSAILSTQAFGHVGAGGSIGFADPAARMSFGYTMNRMGPGILMNERGQGLVDAAYRSLGYTSNAGGVWHK
ncbi:MAG: serine hydrolase domain-containing protein, partial [Pseudomonadota bacterium]